MLVDNDKQPKSSEAFVSEWSLHGVRLVAFASLKIHAVLGNKSQVHCVMSLIIKWHMLCDENVTNTRDIITSYDYTVWPAILLYCTYQV